MAATPVPYLKNLAAKEAEALNLTAKTPNHAAVAHAASTVFSQCTVDTSATGGTAPTITTPSVPLTTVPVTNTTGSNVDVSVIGGTVTEVQVNGVEVGAGDGTYFLPAGGTIILTYSAAPTWVWEFAGNLPDVPAGFVEVVIGGSLCKVPFYNA